MKAIQIHSHGGLDTLQIRDLPQPNASAGEVLVKVKATSINPLDAIVRMGYFPVGQKPPLILGEEATGTVERDVNGFRAGDRVIVYGGGLGVFRDGTWAELVSVPGTAVRHLPEQFSFEEGAALPNVGVTAYGALRTAGLQAGEVLLVLGASGGVGSAGVQIGKALGARVIAVVSKPERAFEIQDLGADGIIASSAGSLVDQVHALTGGKGSHVVLDPVGGEVTGKAMAALAPSGRLVHVGYVAGMNLTINSLDLIAKPSVILGFNIFTVPADRSVKDFDEVVTLAAAGKYRARVGRPFPLAEAAQATQFAEARSTIGKIILTL